MNDYRKLKNRLEDELGQHEYSKYWWFHIDVLKLWRSWRASKKALQKQKTEEQQKLEP